MIRALFDFVCAIKKALRTIKYYFLGAFPAIRFNLLCRNPAQKDFHCYREVSQNVPVLQLVWDYMKLCFRNCPKSFHIQNQLPCIIIILANKFLIYTSCCKSQLMTFAV